MAAGGLLDPVVGRDKEIRRVIQILSRRRKNNPASSASRGWARPPWPRAWQPAWPPAGCRTTLRGKRLLALDLSSMVAGTQIPGGI